MRTTLLVLLSLGIAPTTDAASIDRAFECEKIKQKIEEIRSKMRTGYTRAQGELSYFSSCVEKHCSLPVDFLCEKEPS